MATRGAFWSARSSSDARSRSTVRSPSDGGSYLTKNHDRHTIVTRSTRDRDPIDAQSWRIQRQIQSHDIAESTSGFFQLNRTAAIEVKPRSWLTIAVRSWPDRPTIKAFSPLNQGQFVVKLKPQSRQRESLPRPHQSVTIFGPNFPLKPCILPSCSSTFDRFVKKLSKF